MGSVSLVVEAGGAVSSGQIPEAYARVLVAWVRAVDLERVPGACSSGEQALQVQEALEVLADTIENTGLVD